MAKVDLFTACSHLRVDGDDENELIMGLVSAAYKAVEGRIFRRIYAEADEIPEGDTDSIVADDAINAAVLLIVGHLFANREDVVLTQASALPMGSEFLLTPYINFAGGA